MKNYIELLFEDSYKNRRPISCTIEICAQCNFMCKHCYISDECRKNMLSFSQFTSFIDQIVAMGCIFVTITGGEPLLHPKFIEMYLYAKSKGCIVTVFTNGSLINSEIIHLFKRHPPRRIEITVYGASEETYNLVTETKNYIRVLQSLNELSKNNIQFIIKMFIMTINLHDFSLVHETAMHYGVELKADYTILDNDCAKVQKYQIPTKHIPDIEKQLSKYQAGKKKIWPEYIATNTLNKLYNCGAGRVSCWLKSDNQLRVCNFIDTIAVDLNEHLVVEAWGRFNSDVTADLSEDSDCYKCKLRSFCIYCPARSLLLNNNLYITTKNIRFCEIAKIASMKENK